MKITTQQLKRLIFESVREVLEQEISEADLQFWSRGKAHPEPYSVTPENWSKYTGSEMGRQYFVNRGGNVELGGFLRRYLKSVIGEEGEDGPFKVFHLDPLIAAETFVKKAAGKGASARLTAEEVARKIESAKKSILAAYPNAGEEPGEFTQVDTDYGRGQGAMPVYRRK